MQSKQTKQSNQNANHITKVVVLLVFAFIVLASFIGSLFGAIHLVTFFIEAIFGVADIKDTVIKQELARTLGLFIVSLPIFIVSLKQFLKRYSS